MRWAEVTSKLYPFWRISSQKNEYSAEIIDIFDVLEIPGMDFIGGRGRVEGARYLGEGGTESMLWPSLCISRDISVTSESWISHYEK